MNTVAKSRFTRAQYLNRECTQSQYYAQFVSEHVKYIVMLWIGADNIKASTDEDFNDIPIKEWDAIPIVSGGLMKELGDYLTLAGKVCIAKEAARQIKKELTT